MIMEIQTQRLSQEELITELLHYFSAIKTVLLFFLLGKLVANWLVQFPISHLAFLRAVFANHAPSTALEKCHFCILLSTRVALSYLGTSQGFLLQIIQT
jgi:hypothetical protein